jgi:hypothetical protein
MQTIIQKLHVEFLSHFKKQWEDSIMVFQALERHI